MSVPFHENPLLGFWIEDWIIDGFENMKWDGGFYRETRGHVDEGMNQSPRRAQGAPGRGRGGGPPFPPP